MIRAIAFGVGVTLAGLPAGASTLSDLFTSFYVFGDSLSDNGNRDPSTAPPIYYVNPDTGGIQFSDGPIWTDVLDDAFNSGAPDPVTGEITSRNYAVGGASAVDNGNWPDLDAQVDMFQADLGSGAADAPVLGDTPLVSVFIGGNDLLAIMDDLLDDLVAASNAPALEKTIRILFAFRKADLRFDAVVDEIVDATAELLAMDGIDDIIVFNVPDAGKSPTIQGRPLFSSLYSEAAETINDRLAAELALIGGADDTIYQFDAFGFLNELVGNPGAFGLVNGTGSCVSLSGICANPGDFVFYDPQHLTSAAHAALAERILEFLGATTVPEATASEVSPAAGVAVVPLPAGLPLLAAALAALGILRRARRG